MTRLTFEDLRIIIKSYYPPKPKETNWLEFMSENFLQKLLTLLLKNGVISFKDLATELSNISFLGLPHIPGAQIPSFKGGIGGTPDPSYYDGSEQADTRRSRQQPSTEDISSSSSQRRNDYNDIKYNPSSGNIYGTEFTETPAYIYYDDLLRRLYMIQDYFF